MQSHKAKNQKINDFSQIKVAYKGKDFHINGVPSRVAIYVNTQVVPSDSQGNTAGVTTNQSLDCSA